MTLLAALPNLRTNNLKGLGATLTVQVVPAVVDAVVPAAALGHERGACAENSVQTTVVHFAGAYSANMSAVILRDIRSFPSSP